MFSNFPVLLYILAYVLRKVLPSFLKMGSATTNNNASDFSVLINFLISPLLLSLIIFDPIPLDKFRLPFAKDNFTSPSRD